MRSKKIQFIDEVRDEYNDSIDVGVEFEDDSSYTIVVHTPNDLMDEMLQEKINFLPPSTPMVIVKKLTKDIVNEAIKAFAKGQGYWLKLYQFGDELNLAILNKLDAEHRKHWDGWEEY